LPHNAPGNRAAVPLRGVAVSRTIGVIPRDRIDVLPGLTPSLSGWCCAAGKVNESTAALCAGRQGFFDASKAVAENRCAAPNIK
jgi:hypothetical protein